MVAARNGGKPLSPLPNEVSLPRSDHDVRLAALRRYGLFDADAEPAYDNLTALLAHVAEAPVAVIALQDIDRDQFLSRHGTDVVEVPAASAFRSRAMKVDGHGMLVVEDAREDPRFADNPLVAEHGMTFCSGMPLRTPTGVEIGTVCVLDRHCRVLEPPMNRALVDLARQIEMLFEMRLAAIEAERRNASLERFAERVAHDLKSPISGVGMLADALAAEAGEGLSVDARACVEELERAAESIAGYVDELLEAHARRDPDELRIEPVDLGALVDEVRALAVRDDRAELRRAHDLPTIETDRTTLLQVVLNLVTNAVKYDDAECPVVEVRHAEVDGRHELAVVDRGRGIEPERLGRVFERGEAGEAADRDGRRGTGLGLAAVAGLVERLGGTIRAESAVGEGSTFTCSLPGVGALAKAA